MKGLTILGTALVALLTGNAAALDVTDAQQFLQGSWAGRSETWIFEGASWTQFNGGTKSEGSYSVEAMPGNLFVVVSDLTGKRYVVHSYTLPPTMTWFEEGSTDLVGMYHPLPN